MVYLPHWPPVNSVISLGLERMYQLLEALNNPHLKLSNVIHIAGTNGKGSTLSFLSRILENAGYRVSKYSSPHICEFNERIVINDNQIADNDLYLLLEEVRSKCSEINATFFEITTAAAFLAFSRSRSDIILLETGMGGRLDATNVINDPILSIITPISYDHTEFLGDTLSKIAYEKAGIIKSQQDAVISFQYKESLEILREKISVVKAMGYIHKIDWDLSVTENGFEFIDFHENKVIKLSKPSLFGLHQYINAATAAASAIKLQSKLDISEENIRHGIANTFWPARMERITHGKLAKLLPKNLELWIDGAHNIEGAKMIAATMKHEWNDQPIYLINGRTLNRDVTGFLYAFINIANVVYCVKVQCEPKSEEAIVIYQAAKKLGFEAKIQSTVKEAIEDIIEINKEKGGRIVVCGSLYLSADVKLANHL